MRMGLEKSARSILCAVALVVGAAGWAGAGDEHEGRHEEAERASRGVATGEFVPLAKIIAALRERYEGEIVETELESEGSDQPYYEFHLLRPDGHLIEIRVDARSGRYIQMQSDDD
jgi:uncharacterized membrane protein YkoI